QQAFMERAQATRAAARQEPAAEPAPEPAAAAEVHSDLLHTAPHGLPSLAQVQADLGEAGEDEEIDLGVWDALMRPR
ncbi:MAG: hypothetical protein WAL50_09915, partial [Kineosporiaceae bacterium]